MKRMHLNTLAGTCGVVVLKLKDKQNADLPHTLSYSEAQFHDPILPVMAMRKIIGPTDPTQRIESP